MVSAGVDFSGSTHSAGRGTGRIGPGTWARARAPGRPGAHTGTVTASWHSGSARLRLSRAASGRARAGSRAEAIPSRSLLHPLEFLTQRNKLCLLWGGR